MSETNWSRADLHVHSAHSDGAHDIPTILGHVAEHTDIRVLAITDHDCIKGALEAQRLAPAFGLKIVVGEEVTTKQGHLLALFISQHIPAGLSIVETVARVHAQGGVAILAHPFERMCNSPMRHWPHPTLEDWASFGLDGLEALNGCQFGKAANPRAAALSNKLGLALTGGSDAHYTGAIGVAHTLFRGTTDHDLRLALENRTCVPAGRRWNVREYMGWITCSLIPQVFLPLGALPLNPDIARFPIV